MKNKLNYTDRQRINKKNVSIELIKRNDSVSFNMTRLEINELNLPSQAKIFVEAYHRTELKRFYFGTVASRIYPSSLNLDDIAYSENLKFRVLIVDPENYKILAHAKNIGVKGPAEKKSILPVEFRDLGNEIWRVEFEGEGDAPILCINKKIPNIEYLAKQDSQFFIYVFPAVIKEILTHMVFIDGVDSIDDPEIYWHGDWLKFSLSIVQPPPSIINHENENFDKDEAWNWIENVVRAFSNMYKSKFDDYLKKVEGSL